MKKVYRFTATLLVCFLLLSTKVYAYSPEELHYERFLDTIFFIYDGHKPDTTDLDMMQCVDYATPHDLMELFRQEGVRVHITKGIPSNERTYRDGQYDGLTYPATISWNGQKKITNVSKKVAVYIYDNCTDVTVFYHEFGHALDDMAEYITGYYKGEHPISTSSEWQTLYTQNATTMSTFDNNARINVPRDACEGFAEAFRLYFVYPGKLQASCPAVYDFISKQIAKYTSYLKPLSYSNFDAFAYYMAYPDVAQAIGTDRAALWKHYQEHGKAEGRTAIRIPN